MKSPYVHPAHRIARRTAIQAGAISLPGLGVKMEPDCLDVTIGVRCSPSFSAAAVSGVEP